MPRLRRNNDSVGAGRNLLSVALPGTCLLTLPKRAGDVILGVVLDMLLGPEEDFEYVSRTTPTDTPPTIS